MLSLGPSEPEVLLESLVDLAVEEAVTEVDFRHPSTGVEEVCAVVEGGVEELHPLEARVDLRAGEVHAHSRFRRCILLRYGEYLVDDSDFWRGGRACGLVERSNHIP